MINTFILLSLFQISHAKPVTTSAELIKTEFCKTYQCNPSDTYTNQEGEKVILFRLKKDVTDLDLLGVVKDGSLKKLTLKFTTDDSSIDKKTLNLYLSSLLGKSPAADQLEKVYTGAQVKTLKKDFAQGEKIKIENLDVSVGNVLKVPTVQVEIK